MTVRVPKDTDAHLLARLRLEAFADLAPERGDALSFEEQGALEPLPLVQQGREPHVLRLQLTFQRTQALHGLFAEGTLLDEVTRGQVHFLEAGERCLLGRVPFGEACAALGD